MGRDDRRPGTPRGIVCASPRQPRSELLMKSVSLTLASAVAAFVLSSTSDLLAQAAAGRQAAPPAVAAAAKAGKEADLLPGDPVVSQHVGRFNGQEVRYTAEVGWLPIRDDGRVVAKMGYVAYAKSGVTDSSKRPLIISFNGGPGTASVWMHLGYTGPRRVTYDDEGFQQQP